MNQTDKDLEIIGLREKFRDICRLEGKTAIQLIFIDKQIQTLIDEKNRLIKEVSMYQHQQEALEERISDLEGMDGHMDAIKRILNKMK